MRRTCGGLLIGLAALFTPVAAQESSDRVPTISVVTNLVMLPVTVVDRRGGFVPRLEREQFTVYDNGQPQTIEFFTNDDVPATIGLVVDSSSSMRGRRPAVTAAIDEFVTFSHELDEMFAVSFNEAVWLGPGPGAAFTANGGQLRAALNLVPPQGMTALYDALDQALEHLRLGTRDHKALIVVSDGGDNASRRTLDEVLERARRDTVVIYGVTLDDPDDHDARPGVLKKLARETGGDHFAPRAPADVASAFAAIAREIRSGYTIGFSPPDADTEGFRTIRVDVRTGDRRQLLARTRTGYYAARRTDPVVR